MGKVQSHVKEQCDKLFTEDRKAELKRGLSFVSERACIFKEIALLSKRDFQCNYTFIYVYMFIYFAVL